MSWFFRKEKRVAPEPPLRNRFNRRARIICPNCDAVNPASSRFCNQCGHQLDIATLARTASAALASNAEVPAEFAPEPGEERRVVTILFADLVGSTELADTLDAEELRGLLAEYFTLMAARIHDHGGVVEKFIGDAVMGVFGLPRAHEDDPIRAVRATITMQTTLGKFNAERRAADPAAIALQMRIGVNTGEVIAATGPAEGRDFLVTGDAVNVAARLQQAASPGTTVVGPRTFRNTQSAVDYQTLPPAQLKGKPRPIRVWQVIAMRDTSPVPLARARNLDVPRTALVGRAVEIELIQTIYARVASDRQPHIVTILGEPGVGKTRLAREFIAQTHHDDPEPTVLVGRCALYGEGITYWPVVEMMRDYCDISTTANPDESRARLRHCVAEAMRDDNTDADPAAIALALGYTIGIETPEHRATLPKETKALGEFLFRAWRTFFEAVARTAPLIILVEDIHWADDALLDLLEAMANRSAGSPIIIICTARPEILQRRPNWGGGKRNYVMLALEPLSSTQSEQLIGAAISGTAIPAELRDNILRRAEGNPFFIEEIVRMLIDRGVLRKDATDTWEINPAWAESDEVINPVLPDTVQGVLAARLDLLPSDERDLLYRAAVIGRTFWPDALVGMTPHLPLPRIVVLLQRLVDRDLIAPVAVTMAPATAEVSPGATRYLFKHVLVRDVAYDTIPRARRAHEHEQFAMWLEGFAAGHEADYAESLARHYEEYYRQGGLARARNAQRRQTVRDKATHYLQLAGDRARARFAARTAIRFYTRAISLLRESGDDDRAGTRSTLITLYRNRGDARSLQSDGDGAWQDFRSALHYWLQDESSQPRPPETLALLAVPERKLGMQLYRRLVTLPSRYPSWFKNEPSREELRGYLQAGLQLADEAGDMDSLERAALLTAKTFFWWSWPEGRDRATVLDALESAEEAVAIAERREAPRRASEALDALGNMQATTIDLLGHLRSQARRLYWGQQIDDPNEIIDIHCEVSLAHQMVGEFQRAIEHGSIALRLAEKSENDFMRTQALQSMIVAYYEWDRWADAINDGEQVIAIAARTAVVNQNHYRWGVLATATALTRMGDANRAEQIAHHLDELAIIADSQYVQFFRGRLQLARGNLSEAEQIWRGALHLTAGRHIYPALLAELAELGARQGRADLIDAFGARAITIGERSGARKPLAQALRARGIVALAAGNYADAARDLDDALDRFLEFATRWEEARTRYVLAEVWRRRENPKLAQRELEQALHLFEQVHAVRDIARAKAALAGGDIHLP